MNKILRKNFLNQWFCIFLYFAGMQLSTWLPLRFWSAWGGGNFLDTWQVLNYSKCYESIGIQIYSSEVGNCSNYLYGRTLVQVLNQLNIGPSFTQVFGYAFLLILAFVITYVFQVESVSDFVIISLVLLSPPILLLAERGNFDILIMFSLVIAVQLSEKNRNIYALAVIFGATLLKYYTAPLLLLFVIYKPTKIKLLAIPFFIISALLILRDTLITEADYPHGAGSQFGLTVWGEFLNSYNSTKGTQLRNILVSLFVFIILLFLSYILMKRSSDKSSLLSQFDFLLNSKIGIEKIFIVTFVSCYLAGMNFDYRLSFLAIPFLSQMKSLDTSLFHPNVIFLLTVLWLSFPSGGLQPVGDLILEIGISIGIAASYILRKKSRSKT